MDLVQGTRRPLGGKKTMWPNIDASCDLGHCGYKVRYRLNFHLVVLFALRKIPARLWGWSTLVQRGVTVHPCNTSLLSQQTSSALCRAFYWFDLVVLGPNASSRRRKQVEIQHESLVGDKYKVWQYT